MQRFGRGVSGGARENGGPDSVKDEGIQNLKDNVHAGCQALTLSSTSERLMVSVEEYHLDKDLKRDEVWRVIEGNMSARVERRSQSNRWFFLFHTTDPSSGLTEPAPLTNKSGEPGEVTGSGKTFFLSFARAWSCLAGFASLHRTGQQLPQSGK